MFKFSKEGITLLEIAREALGHGVVIPPRDEHINADGLIGDDWVVELFKVATEFDGDCARIGLPAGTTLPVIVATPEGGTVSHETSMFRVTVDSDGWELMFTAPGYANNRPRAHGDEGEKRFFLADSDRRDVWINEDGFAAALAAKCNTYNGAYALQAYEALFEALLHFLHREDILEKVKGVFEKAWNLAYEISSKREEEEALRGPMATRIL